MKTTKLIDVADIIYGYAFDSKLFNTSGEGRPLIRIRDVNTGFSNTYTTENAPEKYLVRNGDFLIGMDGNFEIVKWANGEALLNQRVCKIIPKSIKPDYLFYLLSPILKSIENKTHSTTVKHLSAKELNKISFELPNGDQQSKIANELSDLHRMLTLKREALEGLDSLVKSRFMEMFGDPNHDDLSKSLPLEKCVTIRDEMRKPINGVTRAKMQAGELFPYYGATGQVGTINEYLSDFEALCIAEDCGNYGPNEDSTYVISGKCWVNNHAHLIQCNKNVDIRYLQHYLNFLDITQYINGATRSKLTQSALKTLPILVPSMDQQLEFKRTMELIDKSRFVVQKEIKDLQELLDSKMDEYFGGEE